jgi:hypothetical protein
MYKLYVCACRPDRAVHRKLARPIAHMIWSSREGTYLTALPCPHTRQRALAEAEAPDREQARGTIVYLPCEVPPCLRTVAVAIRPKTLPTRPRA